MEHTRIDRIAPRSDAQSGVIHAGRGRADYRVMGVSAIAGGSSAYEPITPEARAILVAKREQDADKQQAQALLDMVKQAASGVGQRIDVYA